MLLTSVFFADTKFNIDQDFAATLKVRPSSKNGVILSIWKESDYLHLELVNGKVGCK